MSTQTAVEVPAIGFEEMQQELIRLYHIEQTATNFIKAAKIYLDPNIPASLIKPLFDSYDELKESLNL